MFSNITLRPLRIAPFILLSLTLFNNAQAQTLEYYGELAFYNRGSYIEIVENEGLNYYDDLVIPNSIEGLPVTRIGEAAFKNKTIQSLVLSDSVVTIGDEAFYGCRDMKTVVFSDNLNEIGDRAFFDCEEIEQLALPPSLRTIGSAAFRYSRKLKSISLPEDLDSLGDYAFEGTSIQNLSVPASISVIPAYAYSGTNLTEVNIPDHIVEIGEGAFSSCRDVRSIDLGLNLERIGEYAFSGCNSLSAVVIPETLNHLGTGAFNGCERLAGVIMTGAVPRYVGGSLFSRYNGLPNLYYNAGNSGTLAYANMPWQAYNSTPIQDWKTVDGFVCVVLEEEVYLVAYTGTSSTLSIPKTLFDLPVTKIGTYAFFRNDRISSVRIPRTVKLIEPYAFSECVNLTSVFIEGADVAIDERAFYRSFNLSACVFEDDAPILLGNNQFEARTTLYFYADARNFSEPRHVTFDSQRIVSAGSENGIFYVNEGEGIEITGCSGDVEALVIPAYIEGLPVRSIARGAFAENDVLRTVQLPETMLEIGVMAFRYCNSLESINLPEGIEIIPEEAFIQCISLENINFPSTLVEIGKRAFYRCSKLRNLELSEGFTTIGVMAFDGCPIETINFPQSLETLHGQAFYGCSELRWVRFLGDVNRVANSVFRNCSNLRWVEFGGDLAELEVDAFSYCTSLSAIVYLGAQAPTPQGYSGFLNTPDTITIYHLEDVPGFDNFKYNPCEKVVIEGGGQGDGYLYVNLGAEIMVAAVDDRVESVLIPEQIASLPVTKIGPAAFIETRHLHHIYLPDSLTEISTEAFLNSSLRTIDFGTGVQMIGDRAFSSANNLTFVELPASVQSIGAESFRGCFRLETLVLGENLTTVGDGAFDYSSDLDAVIFLGNAPVLGVDSLGGYSNTKYYHKPNASGFDVAPWTSLSLHSFTEYGFQDGLHYVGDANGLSIVGFSDWWTDGELVIPAQINGIPVTSLGPDLFYNKRIATVTIPSTVHTIESRAFNTVYGLEKVIIDGVLPDNFSNKGIPSTLGTLTFQVYETNVPDDYVSPLSNIRPKRYTGYDSGSDLYYLNTGQEIHIVGSGGRLADITIPSSLEGLPVTRILDRAFHSETDLISVLLPATLERIGEDAFYKCESLMEMIIPDSVTTIGPGAFERCSSLANVQLPIGLEALADTTFYLCTSLPNVSLPEGLLTIGSQALRGCESLSSINIPPSVTTIASSAFRDCTSLTRIVIPEGIERLEAYTFQGCRKLESVQLPSTLNFLGVSAFYQCSELRHVVVPSLVTEIDTWAFKDCQSLNTIVFEGDAPAQIGSDSFSGVGRYFSFFHLADAVGFSSPTWQALPAEVIQGYSFVQDMLIMDDGTDISIRDYCGVDGVLTLPSHFNTRPVTQIAPAAFIGRQTLTSLTIPDSVSTIGEYAFAGCDQLQSLALPDGLTTIAEGTFSACSALESMTLPATVTTIGASAFSGCRNLSLSNLHPGVHSIGDYAFSNCDSIVTMNLPDSLISCGIGVFRGCKGLVQFTIPAGISTVPDAMFQDCSALKTIQFHAGVTGIGPYAFAHCTALQELSFPDSLASIGAYAFQGCVGLSSLVFPEGLTTLGNYAFDSCVGLSSIYFTGDAPQNYGSQAFPGYSEAPMVFFDTTSAGFTSPTWNGLPVAGASGKLGGIYYRVVGSTIEVTGVADEKNVIEIPSFINGMAVTSIGSRAFFRNTELVSIALPDTIEHIGERAFSECERLSGLVLPESLKTIDEHAFSHCYGLVEIQMPQHLESVGDWAFYRCLSLRSVRIAAGGVAFGVNAFYNCSSLASISFEAAGPSVWDSSYLQDYAFRNLRIWYLENSEVSYRDGIFYKISDGTHVPAGDIEIVGFSGFTGWFVIPSEIDGRKVSGISDNAFSGSEDLRYVFLPEGLLRIGNYAFAQCSKLAFIDIPDSVTEIGTQAFNGCIGLRSVTIGRGIETIGVYAFLSTTKLMEILFTGDAPENADYSFFEDNRVVKYYYGAEGFEGGSWLRYRTRPVSHDQSSWREFYGLAEELDLWGAEDNTGSPLVLRYAFNVAPGATGDAYSLKPPANGEDLEISFYSMADDVIYIVETSVDLIEWTTDSVTVIEDPENGRTTAKVPYTPGSHFIRIRVEQNPDY